MAASISDVALAHGFNIALTGEVLLTGRGRLMELLLVPLRPTADATAALAAIVDRVQPTHVVPLAVKGYLLYVASKEISIEVTQQ